MVWDAPLPPVLHPQWQSRPQVLMPQSLHLWWVLLPRHQPRQAVLRQYLRLYLPDLDEAPLPTTASGKPYLPQLNFNWSHSQEIALLAVSGAWAVGVDIEVVRPHPHRLAIARRFFGAGLQTALAAAPEEERDRVFLYGWTYYEAWLKAHGGSLWQLPPALEPHYAYRFGVGDRAVATVVTLCPDPPDVQFFRLPPHNCA